jgi:hypothetical protein
MMIEIKISSDVTNTGNIVYDVVLFQGSGFVKLAASSREDAEALRLSITDAISDHTPHIPTWK